MPPQANNSTIRMFLLKNNDLVIADVPIFQGDGNMILEMPASVMTYRTPHQEGLGFILLPWQPFELLGSMSIVIPVEKNIMCEMTPSVHLNEYYRSWKNHETDKLTRFKKHVADQLQQIIKLSNHMHHEMVSGDNYDEFEASIKEKFEHDKDWGDPSSNN